jgi:putative transposase
VGTGGPSYRGFRFPVEIISHCVWLYYRFPLSFRDVEEMMLQRGIVVSHETVRQWCAKFGQTYANALRRRRARPGDTWHLDEVFLTINGKRQYLWRAVDQDGNVLDILVTSRRDAKAATRFFRKLLTGLEYVPRVLVTDKLTSYGVARRRLIPGVEHRRSKYLNNRAENSHQPTRARERAMKKFRSPGGAQRFLSAFSGISPHFRTRRHLLHAQEYRREMTNRFSTWNDGKVGPGRGAGVATGPFPGAPFRTRRMRLHIPGSPRVLPVGQLPVVAVAGVGGPGGCDGAATVVVAGYRDAGCAGEHGPVVGDAPALVAEAAAELGHPEPVFVLVFGACPPHEPVPGVLVDCVEDGLGHSVSEVVRPPAQGPVEAEDQLLEVLVAG